MILWYGKQLLSAAQVQRLQKHKYATDSCSIVEPFIQPWWNWVVTLLPTWLAPNTITVLGLIVNVITCLILILSCPTATEEVPGWIPISVGIGLFVYQTLDAIDGKQARRTNSSNALGELFDHGCDSVSNLVLCVASTCAMGLGHFQPYWLLVYSFLGTFLFYFAHWQAYVTGRMRFGNVDVTEAQLCTIGVMLVTGIFGTRFWGIELFGFVPVRLIPLAVGVISALLYLPVAVDRILFGGAGRNGSTVAGSSVIGPLFPLLLVLVPAGYLAANSPSRLFERNPHLYILTFGVMASKVCNKLIVAQMTKSELESFDHVLLGPLLMFLNQSKDPIVSEQRVLLFVSVLTLLDYTLYCTRVCADICRLTGWYLFKINVNSASTSQGKNGNRSKS